MTTTQDEMLEKLNGIKALKDADRDDEYYDAYLRREALELELYSGKYGILGLCGCGVPEDTLAIVQKALIYSSLKDNDSRQAYLEEHFGVSFITKSPLVQFLFYTLDTAELIEHQYSIGGSYLTEPGKVFLELLMEYLEHFNSED